LKSSQASIQHNLEKINAELSREKIKVQYQLKLYEERENNFLKIIKNDQ
jgi:hypothetical protein